MLRPIEADDDLDDLEMSSCKYAALNSKLRCIMVCAKSNIIYPDVESNYRLQGIPIPTPQQLLSICVDCLNDLCDAAGDLFKLRAVQEKHRVIFDKMCEPITKTKIEK